MEIREFSEEGRCQWNEFVASFPTGDLLQSFEWGDLKERGGWHSIRLAALENGRIVGAISILKRELPRLRRCIYYAPRGPVCDLLQPRIFNSLLDIIKIRAHDEGAILLKIDPPIESREDGAIRSIEQVGFKMSSDSQGFGGVQPRCVMKLDITSSLDEILAGCKPKWRYNIRLAEKKGVAVRSECTKADLRVFYSLLRETAQRDRFLIRGYEYYEDMWDLLVTSGYARLFLAEYEGEAIAGALSFIFGDKCWYTYGASSNKHRNVMPNHLMQWRMIEWAKNSGCVTYDFRGVSQKKGDQGADHLSGLNRFKEGFGAHLVEYVGEFDLPFSRAWYWVWNTGRPGVASLVKSMKRLSGGSASQRIETTE